jgi:hypothetical protein
VLVATILASSMAFVDGTMVNVALPAIRRDLQATAADAQWVVESYALFLAALLLVGGSLGDRYGRRRIFLFGVGVFGVASLACAAASTVGLLIAARALQGIGAALLMPGSLALISAAFPEAERGRAIDHGDAALADHIHDVVGAETHVVGHDVHIRVDQRQGLLRGVDLAIADALEVVQDLTLQVGRVDHVHVDDADRADARGREVERGG